MSPFDQTFSNSFNSATPPTSATGKSFFPPPTPSPTKNSDPTSTPLPPSVPTSMASSSPHHHQQQQKPQSTPPQRPILNPPLSAEEAKRETQRVGVLLDINRALLQGVVHLQAAGRTGALMKPGEQGSSGGQSSPTVSESGEKDKSASGGGGGGGEGKEEEKKKNVSSREYVECMRRVQANLAYLAAIADRAHKPPEKIPPRPAIMDTLPHIPGNQMQESVLAELKDLYKSLRDLYPGVPLGPVPPTGAPQVGSGGQQGGTPQQAPVPPGHGVESSGIGKQVPRHGQPMLSLPNQQQQQHNTQHHPHMSATV